MSRSADKSDIQKRAARKLYFPDRAAFNTNEEYDKIIKRYWKTIDAYHDMAAELHSSIMKGKDSKT